MQLKPAVVSAVPATTLCATGCVEEDLVAGVIDSGSSASIGVDGYGDNSGDRDEPARLSIAAAS